MSTFQQCPFNDFCHTDVGNVNNVALMFFSGYLTVEKAVIMNGKYYYNLKIQSHERNNEFCNTLYSAFFGHKTLIEMQIYMKNIIFAIRTKNKFALEALLYELFFSIDIIEHQKRKCIDYKVDIAYDEVDIFLPTLKEYDCFDSDTLKNDTAIKPKKDFSVQDYLKYMDATKNCDMFNIKFQVALQSFFERHGFLTKPEILRVNRETHIECASKHETFLFKVNNIKPKSSSDYSMSELLSKVAKNGLEYINYQRTRHTYDNSTTTIHKISIAISPFDKVKVEFAP
jgi:hypothetical protein